MRFSEIKQSFYDDNYESNSELGDIPKDIVEITDTQYRDFFVAINEGRKVYILGEEFIVSDVCPDKYHQWDAISHQWKMTDESAQEKHTDNTEAAEKRKSSLLDEASQAISIWQTKLLLGRKLTDSESAQLSVWLDYIDTVNAIDTSTAPDIEWPVKPE
ncbi:tail fiber assembly protein [Rosenbergiella epipactidis]|uniref:tail fiber assembly protein n=1 Tax=Rosenbergiella epipactidis TaxID=1544694 RepID=UPI001F4E4FE4|nr:tail fiber assembly protein [Rosenbergiella epipactidis]